MPQGSRGSTLGRTIWRYAKWPAYILIALFVAFNIFALTRIPAVQEQQRTEHVVAEIHAQKLTMEDVDGKHLPPPPDPQLVDATVEGIDANQNGIRDDVELAIFQKYPDDIKVRAAMLRYAMTEQFFLTKVFNTETWKAAAEEDGRASSCLALTYPRTNLQDFMRIVTSRTEEVENLVFNSSRRRTAEEGTYEFTTSFGDAPGDSCDLEI